MSKINIDKFVLSFWGYRDFGRQDAEETVKMWKDAGFNVAFSFIYRTNGDYTAQMQELLRLCEKYEMKLILYEDRIHVHRLKEDGEEKYREAVLRAVREFAHYPAAYAFFIMDEPNKEMLPYMRRALEIIGELSPLPAFVNFFPTWNAPDYEECMGVTQDETANLYVPLIKETGLPWTAYDCYSAQNCRDEEGGAESYFRNLNIFRHISEKAGTPLMTSLLSTGHWHYRTPTLGDFRFQLYSAVAHGVKGIQWFMLYDGVDDAMFGDSPIDEFNSETSTYYDMRKVNREFGEYYGDKVIKLRLDAVYHYIKSYGGTPLYADGCDAVIGKFVAEYKEFMIVSRFTHEETGKTWIMVVNGNREKSNRVWIDTVGGKKVNQYLRPGGFYLFEA